MISEKNNPTTIITDGILLLDKALGQSSNQALQKVKKLLKIRKAGHTGSLDPLATGMLPLCLGEATKFSQYLLDADKTYRVQVQLGIKTATGDAEGEIIAEKPVPVLSVSQIEAALKNFLGEIQQVPSMYSALKFKGRPLYDYARKGIEIERKSRTVTIYYIHLHHFEKDLIDLELKCSKGTYVRTLAEDLGEYLGCGAFVKMLRRTSVGIYEEKYMVSESLLARAATEDPLQLASFILPAHTMVSHLPKVYVTREMLLYLKQGQSVFASKTPLTGFVQLFLREEIFVGVGEILSSGMVGPRKILR